MEKEITYKKCHQCGESKDLTSEYWHKNKSRPDGVSVYCKSCMNENKRKGGKYNYLEKSRYEVRRHTKEFKEYQVKYQMKLNKKKYHDDMSFRLMKRMRNMINKYIQRKQKKTSEIIGCTSDELIKYLESKFKKGMSWENYGEWHIDHIIPQSSAKTDEEVYRLNHYTNLQPLWAEENLKKSDKCPDGYDE